MFQIPDDPIIHSIEISGYPPWMQEDDYDEYEDEEEEDE